MCRIVGFLRTKKKNKNEINLILTQMCNTLTYGGPDDAGSYIDESIALGHRRLSILDLSPAGHQPMKYNNLIITYNGEIYNFVEIRQNLKGLGFQFDTNTDTEVILKSFEYWGYDAVKQFRGMFTFAIWDKIEKKLLLCRDRVGVKPLYWYQKEGIFMFASELKSFHEHPEFDKTIDNKSTGLFLQQGYIQSPHCIYKYAHKLEPGHFLEVNLKGKITKTCYWDIQKIYCKSKPSLKKEGELIDELEEILKESFKFRMVADVPVGMFLSGGIDSSLVTALLQKEYNTSLKTFTIGFEDKEKNEAPFARDIAKHIGTSHTEIICTESDFVKIIPELPNIYDEPFGDSSAIPTYLVAQLAKEQVKVSLSADGADELFGGYTKYEIVKNYYSKLNKIPAPIRGLFSTAVNKINPTWLDKNKDRLPFLNKYSDVGNKFNKFQNAFNATSLVDFFNTSSSFLSEKQIKQYTKSYYRRNNNDILVKENQIISLLGMVDITTYLEGDIMTKVDRATMQVALEGREPFLDHHIIEFSQTIPDDYKIRNNKSKYLLRQILYKYVPKDLIDRPKQGFSIPLKKWLLGCLKSNLLELKNDGSFFETFELNKIQAKEDIQDFLEQKRYVNPHFIWFLFTLHQWYKRWL